VFSEDDGLVAPTTSVLQGRGPFSVGEDGRVWIATPAGLAVFDPKRDHPNTLPPIPHVEDVVVDARPIDVRSGTTIPPNPSRLEIRYTATNLRTVDRARLEYRLDGADPDWSRGSPQRVATYMHLRPGAYTFRVRAQNEDGVSSTADATLRFSIAPAWYQAWWFAALIAGGIAASGAGVVYAQQRAKGRRQASELRARYEAALAERERVARELHDTLLQGFIGITMQLDALHRGAGESNPVAQPIERLLTIAGETLRDARRMIWDMRTPELDANDLPRAIERSAERLVGSGPVRLHFETRGSVRPLPATAEMALFRIARESVANALLHAEAATITIALVYEPTVVRLTVRDDGRGFAEEQASAAAADGHMGLSGIRERARDIGATVDISSEGERGTTVTVAVPESSQ
jgi:signal transduction histidine kinase